MLSVNRYYIPPLQNQLHLYTEFILFQCINTFPPSFAAMAVKSRTHTPDFKSHFHFFVAT